MKRFSKCRLILTLIICICIPCVASASDGLYDAQLTLSSPSLEYARAFEAKIEISFTNLHLYNDAISISYHISTNDGEMIRFENERKPVVLNDQGKAMVVLRVDVSNLAGNEFVVQYDLVDINNEYWFTGNDKIRFQTATTDISVDFLYAQLSTVPRAFADSPVLFFFNSCIFVVFIACLLYVRKKKLLQFNT